jgi:hypothetical protein
MARETVHIVQTYVDGKKQSPEGRYTGPLQIGRKIACRTAERLAETKLGVVVFSSSGDQGLGEYDDEPVIIFKTGRLLQQFEDKDRTGYRNKSAIYSTD